jgi:hypothetical protein
MSIAKFACGIGLAVWATACAGGNEGDAGIASASAATTAASVVYACTECQGSRLDPESGTQTCGYYDFDARQFVPGLATVVQACTICLRIDPECVGTPEGSGDPLGGLRSDPLAGLRSDPLAGLRTR